MTKLNHQQIENIIVEFNKREKRKTNPTLPLDPDFINSIYDALLAYQDHAATEPFFKDRPNRLSRLHEVISKGESFMKALNRSTKHQDITVHDTQKQVIEGLLNHAKYCHAYESNFKNPRHRPKEEKQWRLVADLFYPYREFTGKEPSFKGHFFRFVLEVLPLVDKSGTFYDYAIQEIIRKVIRTIKAPTA